jgi:hypothetical protein
LVRDLISRGPATTNLEGKLKRIRSRLTFANVIACTALFVALGGGAYAATQLPKNSVGTKQLKKAAVTPAKLSKAAKSTLTGATGNAGATGPTGPKGTQGLKGERGEKGEKGEKGTAGTTNIHEVVTGTHIAKNQIAAAAKAECHAGQIATGGGVFNQTTPSATLYQDGPLPNPLGNGAEPTGWEVTYKSGAEEFEAFVYVLCATD